MFGIFYVNLHIIMSTILNIETSTRVCSVALSHEGAVVFEKVDREGPNHANILGVFVQEALSFADSKALPLDAVAVSEGPGSYTGLRIGVSMAKGICYARKVPLVNISTLKLICVPVLLNHDEIEDNALFVPMIDARRMEVYAAVYDRALGELRSVQADIVNEQSYREFARPVYYFGDGAAKCQKVLNRPGVHYISGIDPLARWMFPLAEQAIARNQFADVAYFEPFYLKDFIASLPKKLI